MWRNTVTENPETYRHIPQQLAGGHTSELTAQALMTGISGLVYDATSGASAHLSAQVPTGVLATSTLAPAVYAPVASRKAAPTRKWEYGQYARDLAVMADRARVWSSWEVRVKLGSDWGFVVVGEGFVRVGVVMVLRDC